MGDFKEVYKVYHDPYMSGYRRAWIKMCSEWLYWIDLSHCLNYIENFWNLLIVFIDELSVEWRR